MISPRSQPIPPGVVSHASARNPLNGCAAPGVTILVPKYKLPPLSEDERIAKAIVNPMDGAHAMPQQCSACQCKGSMRNPLMGRPAFLLDTGAPKGELYQVFCSDCMVKRSRRR